MAQQSTSPDTRDVARPDGETGRAAPTFLPAVDIFDSGDITVILADMPGVAPDGVDVTLDRDVLTLRGTLGPGAPEGYRPLSTEYREGDYLRVFTLSDDIDRSGIKADFANGVLRLELPRAADARPQKIAVTAA